MYSQDVFLLPLADPHSAASDRFLLSAVAKKGVSTLF